MRHDGRCTLTRRGGADDSDVAASSTARPKGRPLGLLAAWLDCADLKEDKEQHKEREFVKDLCNRASQADRYASRQTLMTMDGAALLAEKERHTAAEGIGMEPEVIV